jgi:D-methionine transport system ATP-binding protein
MTFPREPGQGAAAHAGRLGTHAFSVFIAHASPVRNSRFHGLPLAVIEVRKVDKQFQTPDGPFFALRDVNLSVKSGEIFGIIGRSGAGKSTLLRILNLLERPSAGEVLIEGREITGLDGLGLRRLRQQIGMVFQHFNLLNSRTVYDNVRLPLRIAGGLTREQESQRVLEALDLVGLSDQARKYPRQLSGGQRQRVGIARALADRPRLLLCDEATSALDPETTQAILALLRDINRRLKLTIVLITHGMDVIRTLADRVAVLDHGRIVECGDVMGVFLRPKHPTTRALLAESGVETQSEIAAATEPRGLQVNGASPLWRLTYQGAAVATPVLTATAREHGLDITILQGSIGRIKDEPYAQLTVSISADDEERLRRFSDSLARRDVHCERLP